MKWSGNLSDFLARHSVPEPNSGCLLWLRCVGSNGYGNTGVNCGHQYAHRAAWAAAYGPIPAGLCVLHHCDVRSCINPRHLFLGTKSDNGIDMANKGRAHGQQKTHCPRGHPYEGWNVIRHPRGKHGRICRTCHNTWTTRRYHTKKALTNGQ